MDSINEIYDNFKVEYLKDPIETTCEECGSIFDFVPETTNIVCPKCGAEINIKIIDNLKD